MIFHQFNNILYLGAIFWTLGYDTIYGFQDIKDDEIIGVKSTSIKFKDDPKKFLFLCYSIFLISLIIVGVLMNFKIYIYFIFYNFIFTLMIHFQIFKTLKISNTTDCLKKFKSNNLLGLIIPILIFL